MNNSKTPPIFFFFFLFFAIIAIATMAFSKTIPALLIKAKKRNYLAMHAASSRISQDQMMQSGITSLSQALQTLGGLQLQDLNGSGKPAISMRGFGANAGSNSLILINGLPVTYPDIAPTDLSIIPLQEIRYIEVIEGSVFLFKFS